MLASARPVEVALVAVAAVLAATFAVRPDTPSAYAVIAVLALAMGVRNAAVRRLGVPDLTTTVLTMTITALAVPSNRRLRAATLAMVDTIMRHIGV